MYCIVFSFRLGIHFKRRAGVVKLRANPVLLLDEVTSLVGHCYLLEAYLVAK